MSIRRPLRFYVLGLSLALSAFVSRAHNDDQALPPKDVPSIEIQSARPNQIGQYESASTGVVTKEQLSARTVYRPGELLEATPGLIVSQHSGEGKANQFYLRGFNLDHGTDLRTTLDGMLVNQRSHAHGQGWSDLNFLIPELVTRIDYRKGPSLSADGDFAAAGAAQLSYANQLERGILSVGVGANGYRRSLLANSKHAGAGQILYALEAFHNDGPFVRGDDYRKFNAVLRYSQGTAQDGMRVTAMAYHGRWNSSDQLPQRAVDDGRIDRFDVIDPSDGGHARRISLSADWRRSDDLGAMQVNAWVAQQSLALFSNFTYFLDDPINGDQFAQPDRRVTTGLNLSRSLNSALFGAESESVIGLALQNDNIFNRLSLTKQRVVSATIRADHIVETSAGLYIDNVTRWWPWLRSTAGLRADQYQFHVRSDRAANSGRTQDSIVSPRLGLAFGPWRRTVAYVNWGTGFHSNDARGTTIQVDPRSGEVLDAKDRVTPLARARGLEFGLRSQIVHGLTSSLSLYRLNLDSELLFIGDAGNTEASRPSRRVGFEITNEYQPLPWLSLHADLAFARARFRDVEMVGDRIPGAVESVASLALAIKQRGPWSGALQLRYFGPRPLVEDNAVRSNATTTLNGRIAYQLTPAVLLELEGFNLANRRASAIDYYYTSRLPGEPAEGIAGVHFHPIESRSVRLNLVWRY